MAAAGSAQALGRHPYRGQASTEAGRARRRRRWSGRVPAGPGPGRQAGVHEDPAPPGPVGAGVQPVADHLTGGRVARPGASRPAVPGRGGDGESAVRRRRPPRRRRSRARPAARSPSSRSRSGAKRRRSSPGPLATDQGAVRQAAPGRSPPGTLVDDGPVRIGYHGRARRTGRPTAAGRARRGQRPAAAARPPRAGAARAGPGGVRGGPRPGAGRPGTGPARARRGSGSRDVHRLGSAAARGPRTGTRRSSRCASQVDDMHDPAPGFGDVQPPGVVHREPARGRAGRRAPSPPGRRAAPAPGRSPGGCDRRGTSGRRPARRAGRGRRAEGPAAAATPARLRRQAAARCREWLQRAHWSGRPAAPGRGRPPSAHLRRQWYWHGVGGWARPRRRARGASPGLLSP